MKKIVAAILLVGSSVFAQGNSSVQTIDKVYDVCLKTVQAEQAIKLNNFISTHDGQITKDDILMFQSDLNIVARMKTRNCAASTLNQYSE